MQKEKDATEEESVPVVEKFFHPPKHYNFPKTKCGKRDRSCQFNWFEDFPWLHYDERTDSVLCHYCIIQERKGNLKDSRSKEDAYISKGFRSWKKAPKCFQNHKDSVCHKTAATYQLTIPKCQDIGEMINSRLIKRREAERKYLLQVIRSLLYLGRQGIALQGHDGNDNLTQLLLLLGTNDKNISDHLEGNIGHKYVHSDVQNEILNIIAALTLQEKLKVIEERKFFSIIADEGTDVSNKEQLSFCLRTVNDNLQSFEDFIGFYQLENIKSDTIVRVMKDILLRLNITLDNCRGQTYDGASNMMGKRSGVSSHILVEQPKSEAIHCQGHSLSLCLKSLTKECDLLRDTLRTVKEICVLVKYSPKRENVLGNINENIERAEDDSESINKLTKLSMTRWTVRAECMKRILSNYRSLLLLWEECLEEKLDQETKARIIGCKAQMDSFNFFFSLNLSQKLYAMMSALKGRKCAELVIETISAMRNKNNFLSFYNTVKEAAMTMDKIGQPKLPGIRNNPKNYSILEYVSLPKGEKSASEAYDPKTPEDFYLPIYNGAIDTLDNAMRDRFNQPALKRFENVEQLLLKAISNQDFSSEFEILKRDFCDDFHASQFESELDLLRTVFKTSNPVDFRDFCKTLQTVEKKIRPMLKNTWTIIRIVLTSGATSATPERSFSLQRRIKTWIRSTMGQKRYNSLAVLKAHTLKF